MYSVTYNLKHTEAPSKTDLETGEVTLLNTRGNNIPENKEIFEPKAMFRKSFDETEEFLDKVLTPLEFKVVMRMSRMAKANTNSLQPLNDDLSIKEIAEELNINRRDVPKLLKKLFDLGVYGKFEVVLADVGYTKYWVLNPYIKFKGKTINSEIANMFKGTVIHKSYMQALSEKRVQ